MLSNREFSIGCEISVKVDVWWWGINGFKSLISATSIPAYILGIEVTDIVGVRGSLYLMLIHLPIH